MPLAKEPEDDFSCNSIGDGGTDMRGKDDSRITPSISCSTNVVSQWVACPDT